MGQADEIIVHLDFTLEHSDLFLANLNLGKLPLGLVLD